MSQLHRHGRSRSGFTLLEVLVATAITLLMMISLAKIFAVIGQSMKQGRAALELNSKLRDVCHRVNRDLNNLTANPGAQPGSAKGTGYFLYHDGSQTDYSTTQLASGNPSASRIGDVDDIIMGTVRAGDIWYTGKIPLFILEGRSPYADDDDGNGVPDDFEAEKLISVGAQHAEIAYFMQPLVASENTRYAGVVNTTRHASHLIAQPGFYQDNDGDTVPDGYRLHYRVKLIRPDLNLTATGALPNDPTAGLFLAEPQYITPPGGTRVALPTPLCDMSTLDRICDLSIRRVHDGNNGTSDAVAANSLEDLENPANRFAHVQLPIPGTNSTTMPVLALGPAIPIHSSATEPRYIDFTGTTPTVSGPGLVGSGFLHPAFTLQGSRTGEDILANNMLAFDVKAYDPGAPILASLGADGSAGVAGVNDDGDALTDNSTEIGWAGSDDLILDPNDPGYGTAMVAGGTVVGLGQYVDLGWAKKIDAHGITSITAAMNSTSQLSGDERSGGTHYKYTTGLAYSGKYLVASGTSELVYQHTYDTWTPEFEGDGILQTTLGSMIGISRINGSRDLFDNTSGSDIASATPAWRRTNATASEDGFDASQDGLDNNGIQGADEAAERETSPPFAVPLRGIKIMVRMEDQGTRQVKELPVSVEFVSQ